MRYLVSKPSLINVKRTVTALLILTSLFTFVTPIQTALSLPGPHAPTITFDVGTYQLEDLPIVRVDHPAANTDNSTRQTVQVTITSTLDPIGITLVLNETTTSSHIFENLALVVTNSTNGFPFNTNANLRITNATLNTDPNTIQTVNTRIRSFDPVTSTFRETINPFTLQETGVNTGVFSRAISFRNVADTDPNTLLALPGDIITTENLDNSQGLNYLLNPNPHTTVRGIAAANGNTLFASYPAATTASASISDTAGARPLLSLVATSQGGGGRDTTPPSFTLGRSSVTALSLPDNILNTILEADSFTPIMPLNDPSIDYPLSINGKGFILSQYANTIETQTVKTGELVQLKILASDASGIAHVGLYTNIHGFTGEIQNSDTYIVYDKENSVGITDPNNIFSNVTLTTSKEGTKHEFLYNITFAKPMDTSDIIFRIWDEKRNSADTKIFDAIKVVGEPIINPGVANLALAQTAAIVIPYYKFPQYTIPVADSDGNLIYHNPFGGLEHKIVTPYHEPAIYPDSVSRLERHDTKQLYDTINNEQKKAEELMLSKFSLDTSTFVVDEEIKPYHKSKRASEFALCGISVGCGLDREDKGLLQKLLWEEHLRAEKTLKSLTKNNYQDD